MTDKKFEVHRRNFLRVLGLGTATTAVPFAPAFADTETDSEKLEARYQANSPEVQTFYRVNRYPAK